MSEKDKRMTQNTFKVGLQTVWSCIPGMYDQSSYYKPSIQKWNAQHRSARLLFNIRQLFWQTPAFLLE